MLHKVVISELFGQIDLELKLSSNSKITVLTAASGYGKTTLLQLIHAFYRGDLPSICNIDFSEVKFYLNSEDNNEQYHTVCFSKTQDSQLEFTLCNETSGQISEPQLFDLNDFSHLLPADELKSIGEKLTLESNTHIDIWGNDDYAQTCLTATVNQHPEAVNWQQQLYSAELTNLLGPINTQYIDAKRENYPFNLNAFNLNDPNDQDCQQSRYDQLQQLIPIEQCATDLVNQFQSKITQYHANCEKLNNSFAKRLIDQNTHYSQLEREVWLSQYTTLYKSVEKILAFELLDQQDIEQVQPQDIRQDDLKLLALYVQDSKIKFIPFEKLMDKVELFTTMVNHNLSFKAIKPDVNNGFEVYNDHQQQLELTSLSEGEQQLIVLLYQIIMLIDDNQLVLIDTPETALSSQWQVNIKKQLQKLSETYTAQIIIATHSQCLINDEKALQTKRCEHCGQLH